MNDYEEGRAKAYERAGLYADRLPPREPTWDERVAQLRAELAEHKRGIEAVKVKLDEIERVLLGQRK